MQMLKDEVRSAIVQSALVEFRQYGYSDASMRRIAKAAGVTTGNIYRYFRGKEELFDCIVGPVYVQYSQYVETYLQKADFMIKRGEDSRMSFFEQVQSTLVGLLKASGPGFMLLLCRSQGSKYEGIKRELIHFVDSLLLIVFAASKQGDEPLNEQERAEVGMLSATMIDSFTYIIGQYEEQNLLGLLIDRLISVYSAGIDRRIEEFKEN